MTSSTAAADTALAQRLLASGRLSMEQLSSVLVIVRERGVRLATILVEKGFCQAHEVTGATQHPPEVEAALRDPTRVIGQYALLAELGRGAMGVVSKAWDTRLQRQVAIKVIIDRDKIGPKALHRFQREAVAGGKMRHPGIVAVYEYGEHMERPYLVLEYVEGEPFSTQIKRTLPDQRRAAEVVRDVALALDHAHQQGIVHRDVKPHNVLIDKAGKPHLMDFGVAREMQFGSAMTMEGELLGTPEFMSPEQAAGEVSRQGPSCDVYGLGAMLYYALTGKAPFKLPTIQAQLKAILLDKPEPPRKKNKDVHPILEAICLRCLAKEPEQRFPSAAALAEALDRWLGGGPAGVKPQRLIARKPRGSAPEKSPGGKTPGGRNTPSPLEARKKRRPLGLESGRQKQQQGVVNSMDGEDDDAADGGATFSDAQDDDDLRTAGTIAGTASGTVATVAGGTFGGRTADPSPTAPTVGGHENPPPDESGTIASGFFPASNNPENPPPDESGTVASGIFAPAHQNAAPDESGTVASHVFGPTSDLEPPTKLLEPTRLQAALDGGTLISRGLERAARGDLDGALADFGQAVAVDPGNARGWSAAAEVRYRRGELDLCLHLITRSLELQPSDARAWSLRAAVCYARGDAAGAVRDATHAVTVDPRAIDAWLTRASARHAQHDLVGAVQDYTRAIEIERRNASAWLGRGLARRAQGDPQGALGDVSCALSIEPRLTQAWVQRAALRAQRGEHEGAIADCTRALELEPSAEVYSSRAWVRLALGDFPGVVSDATRALEIDPNLAAAHFNRGLARKFLKDALGALVDFERFLQLAPAAREAPRARAEVAALRGR